MFSKLLWSRSSRSRNSSRQSLPQQGNDTSAASSAKYQSENADSSQLSSSDADLRLEYTKSFSLLPSFHRDRRPLSRHRHARSDARSLDPQGLNILYTPPSSPSADIIFIHGLGGSSRLTWAKDHDISLFWPLEWLPLEEGISSARISSFGYDAQFKSQQQRGYLSISDFAKDLLYQMRYIPNDDSTTVPLGEHPIIFVAHSMGGLVFKKAFLYGQNDDAYKHIIDSVRAVLFLSTPHQGTHLADQLNKLLRASVLHSPQKYIAEMTKNGPYIEEINEQFRNVAPRLQIFSFYETQPTDLGPGQRMILKKTSATLGYPKEVCKPINADHHDICKYSSIRDVNYQSVRAVLQSLVTTYRTRELECNQEALPEECERNAQFLSAGQLASDHDLSYFLSRWNPSTCAWMLQCLEFQDWLETPADSKILWVHGKPGRGKSVLSAYLVHHLQEHGFPVQYFFFRFGEQAKRSIGSLLRSLAFQLSQTSPTFRKSLMRLRTSGLDFKQSNWQSIWERIFKSTLFTLDLAKPIYWIIDGIDESEALGSILNMLGTISSSATPIRILLVSRWSTILSTGLAKLDKKMPTSTLCADGFSEDFAIYAEGELADLPWPVDLKKEVIQKVADRATGNFLWVHLALEEIKTCHTMKRVKGALEELPSGMESLYERMVTSISRNKRHSDTGLQRCLFIWIIYSRASVAISELSQALEPEWSLLDLRYTVSRLCGHFVVIEDGQRLGLIHETAREYLKSNSTLPFSLEPEQSNYDIFQKCISALQDPTLRSRPNDKQRYASLVYRATSWAYHLNHVSIFQHSDSSLQMLLDFFRGESVLSWIETLAVLDKLSVLIDSSRRVGTFVERLRKDSTTSALQYLRLADLELLQLWTRDLLKLVAKFGSNMLSHPTAIHDCIIPFCPSGSAIYKTFQRRRGRALRVRGLSDDWDDCLARVSIGSEYQTSMVSCSARYLAVLNTAGTITVWDSLTFKEIWKLQHGEFVYTFCVGSDGSTIASYGLRTTKIWSAESGEVKLSVPSISSTRALTIEFAEKDTLLLMASESQGIFHLSVGEETSAWKIMGSTLPNENQPIVGANLSCPTGLAFSHDRKMIMATYRRYPLTIWSLPTGRVLKQIIGRRTERTSRPTVPYASHVEWHPNGQEILGIFADGCIFKTEVHGNLHQELEVGPGRTPFRIHCSPDGRVFATSDLSGMINVYDYQNFSLLYQLTHEDTVNAFCFSHDSTRFYDIRGNYCNVWEPNVLIRLSDPDYSNDLHSEDGSIAQSNMNSEAVADMAVSIKALCPASRGSVVCTSDDEGLVEIHDFDTGERQSLGQSPSQMSVESLAWSGDCSLFAYADDLGKVALFSLQVSQPGGIPLLHHHRALDRFKPQSQCGGIEQVLLSSNGDKLLIVLRRDVQLWSTQPPSFLTSIANAGEYTSRWVLHPKSRDQILAVTSDAVTARNWSDLSDICKWNIPAPCHQSQGSEEGYTANEQVSQAFVAYSKRHLIITFPPACSPKFAVVEIGPICTDQIPQPTTLQQVEIPKEIMAQIERPLNIFRGRLMFIDRSFWICSWRLDSGQYFAEIQRYFFLPKDWINVGSLNSLHLTENGTIIYPRRGQLAVIESAVVSEW